MKRSLETGLSFGLTSGVITTLGLIVGLHSGTHSRLAVIGGVLTIAIADAFSDALGIHVSEEAKNSLSGREVWEATFATFLAKFFFALTFVLPLFFLPLDTAIPASVVWGFLVLGVFSYAIGKRDGRPWNAFFEHILIAVAVILLSHFVGDAIAENFS